MIYDEIFGVSNVIPTLEVSKNKITLKEQQITKEENEIISVMCLCLRRNWYLDYDYDNRMWIIVANEFVSRGVTAVQAYVSACIHNREDL